MNTTGRVLLAIVIAGSSLTSVRAQSTLPKAEQDSLWAVWSDPAQADTSRLRALDRIVRGGFLYSQPDSAFYYAQLHYDLAESKGLKDRMARALNNQGVSYAIRGDYLKAMDHYQRSLTIGEEIGDKKGIAFSLISIGDIYQDQGDHARALDHHKRSLKIRQEIGDEMGIATALISIGKIYQGQGDHSKALDHYKRSLKIYEEFGDEQGRAYALGNIGTIHQDQGDTTKALDHYQRSLKIREEIGNKRGISLVLIDIGRIHQEQGDHPKAMEHYLRSLRIREEFGDQRGAASSYTLLGELKNKEKNHAQALAYCKTSLTLAEEMEFIVEQKEACQCLYTTYKALGRDREALVYLEKLGELDKQLNKEETAKKIQQMEFQQVMLQDSIAKAEETRLLQEAHQEEVRAKNRTRNMFAGGGAFFVLLAGGFYTRARYMRRSRAVLQVEKDRSENLLLNILPAEIAEELKQKGRSEARDYELVSILFTDFKDFTEHSATMSAATLVNEINHCFEAFDGIMAKYGIEKIKTIGDAYMAAGGVPVPTEDSVKNTVLAALEMQKFIRERKVQKDTLGEPAFEMRVGIHTGPVVAGIVGVKKFQYDIWGDTVNTASRMESSGVVGQVNISESTYRLLQDDPQFEFTPRGKVEAKGKGELEMFLVQENEAGTVNMEERRLESTPD
jgi:adenylate cyclase